MKMLKKLSVQGKKKVLASPEYTMRISSQLFSLLVLVMAVGIMIYAGSKVYLIYKEFFALNFRNILYDAVFLIVLVKAFQILLRYYQKQYVSIKQILEIAIVALVVSMTFAFETRDVWMNVVLGVFTLGNLVVYLIFYDKLADIENK